MARSGSSGSGGGTISPGTCDPDPLETGLVAEQTGVSADVADCSILKWAAQYGEPDPMIVKAMIYGESRFDYAADRLRQPAVRHARRLDRGRSRIATG